MAQSPVPDELFESWQATLSQWANKLTHDVLLGRAVKHDQLAWLAMRYREAARANPQDPIARDRMKGVQRAATMLAFAAASRPREASPKRSGPLLLATAVITTCLALFLTDYVRLHRPIQPPQPLAASTSTETP